MPISVEDFKNNSFLWNFFLSCSPGRKRDFSPVLWSQYFESMEDVVVENDTGKDISFFFHIELVIISETGEVSHF